MNLRTFFRSNCLTRGVLRDLVRGETSAWTREDWWAALVKFPAIDVHKLVALLLLDHTGHLGMVIKNEVLTRRAVVRGEQLGSLYPWLQGLDFYIQVENVSDVSRPWGGVTLVGEWVQS